MQKKNKKERNKTLEEIKLETKIQRISIEVPNKKKSWKNFVCYLNCFSRPIEFWSIEPQENL